MFSNTTYHIEKPYSQFIFIKTNVKTEVPKLSFVGSVIDTDHTDDSLETCALVQNEQIPIPLMTNLLNHLCITEIVVANCSTCTGLTFKVGLLALKRSKFSECGADISYFF